MTGAALSTTPVARISGTNYVRAATTAITSGTAAAQLPCTNVANDSPYNTFWQTASGTTTDSLYFDFGANVSIDDLALDGLTLSQTDTIRHRLSSSGAGQGAGDVYDSGAIAGGVVPGYDLHSVSLAATQSARFWRVDIVATSRASIGSFRVGRAWAGPSAIPTNGVGYNYSDGWSDPSQTVVAPFSGKKYINVLPKFRVVSFSWEALNQAQAMQNTVYSAGESSLKEITRLAGVSATVLFVPDPTSSSLMMEAVMGYLTKLNPITHPQLPLWGWAGEVSQSL